jgi:hypothetical protein
MESQPFDHHTLARFFLGVAGFILCLCVGNSVILRGEVRLGILFLLLGAGAAYIEVAGGAASRFRAVGPAHPVDLLDRRPAGQHAV